MRWRCALCTWYVWCTVWCTRILRASGSLTEEEGELEVLRVSLLQTRKHVTKGGSLALREAGDEEISECSGAFPVCGLAKHEVCAYIPGCSWRGETAYGGWCLSSAKEETSSSQAGRCGHLDEGDCKAAKAASSPCRWEGRWRDFGCAGDGGRWQNPSCSFTNDPEACMALPGCNFQNRSYYGGWCVGNEPHCAFQLEESCAAPCSWVHQES
mmetsp:Transcript_61194/g.114427  ORF Transcript_61194/g.114427 Transcript_61194/m.114427 type:complete len:212 (-) Transcript_61194:58-693(-)